MQCSECLFQMQIMCIISVMSVALQTGAGSTTAHAALAYTKCDLCILERTSASNVLLRVTYTTTLASTASYARRAAGLVFSSPCSSLRAGDLAVALPGPAKEEQSNQSCSTSAYEHCHETVPCRGAGMPAGLSRRCSLWIQRKLRTGALWLLSRPTDVHLLRRMMQAPLS